MQTHRLFEIIYLLLSNENMTAKALAERFGVSTRTIYRDVDTLSLAGIPVYMEKGRNGGIRLLPDFVLNKSILSEHEQNEILTALQSLSMVGDGEAGQVLRRLSGIFNKTVVNWLEVDFSDWSFGNGDVFDGFKTAILEKRIAEFDYFSAYGEKTRRQVEPIQLWFKSRAWYIKGYCLTRLDVRLFRLTRVHDLTVTDTHFAERHFLAKGEPEPLSADAQNRGHDSKVSDGNPPPGQERHRPDVTMRLYIAPEMAYRVYDEYAEHMVEKQPCGGYIVKVTWPMDNWVYGTLLSYGEHLEVLEPEYLRQEIKSKAEKIVKRYL